MNEKGLFITFEGGEAAGKSTLIKKVKEYLVSLEKDVLCTFEPGDTEFGKSIRAAVLDGNEKIPPEAEFFLYLADRAYHVEKMIMPALESGKMVLCDRFTDSSVAYQGEGRRFVSLERIEEMSLVATRGLTPDLTFYLDIDPKIAFKRLTGKKDRLEREDISFHEKVREGYLLLARDNPHRIVVINAEDTIEDVFAVTTKHLDELLKKTNLNKV
ncbi:MAG: Thymidylate kinase [Chlamydiia bacterium]|nr:Thymidylate kinase [Chlamydiia bacterium]MCH9618104.1 Thymidylate kinase [Chlamydiia bacterium]MCH9623984.1 Thymidylate kinase [Chlamydiia bacterium]